MTSNLTLLKSGLFILMAVAFNMGAKATTFTAIANGNFSSAATWTGAVAPAANLTTADNIVIGAGISVVLDEDVIINNASASLALSGTLSGTHSLNIQSGTLSGTLIGQLNIHDLTLGASSTTTYAGTTVVDNMYNSEALLSLAGATTVNDTTGLMAGVAEIGTGIVLTLTGNATLLFNGGTFSPVGGGTITQMGNVNLVYSGTGTLTTGAELALTNINNVTVNLASSSNQLSLSSDLSVLGQMNVTNGSLNLNGHNLTLNGTVNTSASGSLSGNALSNLTLGGAGNMGTLMFTSGSNTINNLTVNGGVASYVSLGTDMIVGGMMTLTSGGINLTGSSNLTLTGMDSIAGGSAASYVATSGTGSLIMNITGGVTLTNSRTLHIGTASAYAPVRVTNSSTASGNFSGNAHSGIFANGTSGSDLSATYRSVNTSWNIESDITSGANVSLEAYWSTAMEVNSFNTGSVYLSHYINSAWDDSSATQATAHAGGMFSVKRTGINSFSPFAVFSNNPAGIAQVNAANAFSTYPNPATDALTVSIANPLTNNDLKVYDILGNQIANYSVHNSTNTIDISALNAGVYFLSVNNTYTQKFVKQ